MNEPTGITGPQYTDEEEAYVKAGIELGRTAKQIARHLPNRTWQSVYNHALNVYKVKLLTTASKNVPVLPETGRVAFRVPDEDRAAVQAGLEALVAQHGFSTLTDCAVQALKDAGK